MGDLFGAFQNVSREHQQSSFEDIAAYEEHYMRLLKKYEPEIQAVSEMLTAIRDERKRFYEYELPSIKKAMIADDVLSKECMAEWLTELQSNMEHSFQLSESLIQHYITKNLEEFRQELHNAVRRV